MAEIDNDVQDSFGNPKEAGPVGPRGEGVKPDSAPEEAKPLAPVVTDPHAAGPRGEGAPKDCFNHENPE